MSNNRLRENLLAEMGQSDRARFEHNLYNKAFHVFLKTENDAIKRGCYLMACHMQGKPWCHANNEKYLEMNEIDWQIINDEYDRLVRVGVVKP